MKNTGARKVFERIIAVCIELTRPQGASQPEIARRFEVSTKTVQRDFNFLRDNLLLPLEYNPHTYRWELHSPDAIRKIEGIGAVFANLQ